MAIDKDPSIYRDRGTIGSSDELDEYGVWVKSEPQVLRPDVSSAEMSEPSLPDIEDLPDLDIEFENEPARAAPVHLDMPETLVPDFSDSAVFSVEDSPAAEASDDSIFEDIGALETERAPLTEDSFTELSMDDFLDTQTTTAPAEDLDISIETVSMPSIEESVDNQPLNIDLEFHDEDIETNANDENVTIDFPSETTGFNEPALENVSEFDDFLNDLSDGSSPTPPSVTVESMEIEKEDTIQVPIDSTSGISLETREDDVFSSGNNQEEISVDLSISDGLPEIVEDRLEIDEHFDDVEAVGKDLQDSSSKETHKMDLSTELLMRIADELSSIKTELSSLKGELGVLRAAASAPTEEAKAETHEASHGFFDEEDDEKIALTGDELDNILNTADFTEEAGADAGMDIDSTLSMETPSADFLSDKSDIIADEEPAVEKIEIENEVALSEEDLPELSELRETGVRPMTEAPEDTSYLETEETVDASGVDILGAETIDLTEAVIEEPDLGNFVLEETAIEEPSIDSVNIDLDLGEEDLHVEEITLPPVTEVEEETDIDIGEALKEESFEEVLPEGFIVESEPTLGAPIETEEVAEEIETAPTAEVEEEILETVAPAPDATVQAAPKEPLPANLKGEIRAVLAYMDQLLESLPESKIEEFAKSEYFDTYKKLFEELGLA